MRGPRPETLTTIGAALIALLLSPPAMAEESLGFPVVRTQLDNGLRVIMSPDRSTPVVSVAVYYDVGSRNETHGHSGFAHLFEHMMFQGSENVGKMEHFALVNAAGGSANGTTSSDRTNYYETLPSHQLSLGLWLEADRMRSLDISDRNFENQRAVVINEYRQSYENRPYGLAFLRANALAFGDYFPYANPTIGSIADLERATRAEAEAFWQGWYGPNNAVLSISGDFDPAEAEALVRQHFGGIPRRAVPQWTDPGFSGQTEERREVMYDRLAPLPALFTIYHIPPSRHADHYAVELLSVILGDGESSRFHRLLVEENQVCVEARAYTDDRRGPDLFNAECILADGHTPDEAATLMDQELERVRTAGITDREMTKAKNRVRAYFVFGLQTTLQRARNLAEFELYHGDATLLLTELNRYLSVTPQQVQEAARRYLVATNRSSLTVLPGEAPDEGDNADESNSEPATGEEGS